MSATAPTATRDRNGLIVLDRAECLGLLRTQAVGRVALTMQALPVILPVNFALSPTDDILFRSGTGAKLRAALHGVVIAFEVDGFDPAARTGWSVLVQGTARVVGEVEADELGASVRPWSGTPSAELVVLTTDVVSGRVLDAPQP